MRDSDDFLLTGAERNVVLILGAAWDQFLKLPIEHGDDVHEFRAAIHRAQDMVLARPGRREINADFGDLRASAPLREPDSPMGEGS